ncbi:MAG TPA: hypothetical protein V6D11_20450 [Waterburya sp.]
MKRSIHTLELFREADFLGGTAITKLPTYSESALEAWNRTADKGLIYNPSNDTLTPNWNDDGIRKETGLDASIEETKMYIKALSELPRLILHDCGIGCSKEVLQILDDDYSTLSKYMEFLFFNNTDAIVKMNSSALKTHTTRADTSNAFEGLSKDIWRRKEDFCQWAKAFSISELWFCGEIETCFVGLQKMELLPGGQQETKEVSTKEDRNMIEILKKPGTSKLIYPKHAPEVSLSPYHAVLYTADKLAQQNVFYVKSQRNPSAYKKFLQCFLKHSNYLRKNNDRVRVRVSPDGQRLVATK